jgi:hypothetical protein
MRHKLFRVLLCGLLLFVCQSAATAATIDIQSVTLPGWNDTRTNVELWVFSDTAWTDVNGIGHGAGNVQDKVFTQRISGLTVNLSAHTITVPPFSPDFNNKRTCQSKRKTLLLFHGNRWGVRYTHQAVSQHRKWH